MLHQISQVSLGEVSEWSKAQAGGVLDTPMGELFLVAHPQGLSGIWFVNQRHFAAKLPASMVQQFLAQDAAQSSDPILQATVNWLRCYFASGHEDTLGQEDTLLTPMESMPTGSEPTLPALPPLYLLGTPFQLAVWQELLRVPYGQTISYAQLTAQVVQRLHLPSAYKGYRGVAQAVGHNPVSILVPCHRIIGSDGKLTGFASGLAHKEFLLHLEGAL